MHVTRGNTSFISSELWKSHERVKKLDAMSKRRDLPERERLVFQLQEFREEMNEKERQITVREEWSDTVCKLIDRN